MVENTRLKELAFDLKRASETLEVHENPHKATQQHLARVENTLSSVQHTLDSLTRAIDRPSVSLPMGTSNPLHRPSVKLDFLRFNDTEPLNWLFRAEQFFSYYGTPDSQRLTIVAVHFEGSMVPWFQMLQKSNQLST